MSADMIPLLSKALGETVYMVVVSMIVATIIGVPLGVLLHTTSKGQILESPAVNRVVGAIVNAVRCVPPENKPTTDEINACRPFFAARLAAARELKAIIALGKIAHDSTLAALGDDEVQTCVLVDRKSVV